MRAAGDGAVRYSGDGAGFVRACTTRKKKIDALARGISKVQEVFALMAGLRDLYQEVILEHSKAPRNYRELSEAESQG